MKPKMNLGLSACDTQCPSAENAAADHDRHDTRRRAVGGGTILNLGLQKNDAHATVAEIAGHPGIWRLLLQVKVNVDRMRRLTLPQAGRMTGVIAEHAAILSAVEKHDRDGAAAAMGKHLERLLRDISAIKDINPEFFDGPS